MFAKKRSHKILFTTTATTYSAINKHFGNVFPTALRSHHSFKLRLRTTADGKKLFQRNEKKLLKLTCIFERYSSDNRGNNVLQSKYGSISASSFNLPQFIWRDAHKWSDKPMITCGQSGKSYTFGQGEKNCLSFAHALISKLYLKKGDVVGLLLPNLPEYVVSIHGALQAGAVVTFINPLYTSDEIRRQFENADVKYCVTIPELLNNLEKAVSSLKNYIGTILIGDNVNDIKESKFKVYNFNNLLTSNENESASLPLYDPKNAAVLPYSSGTTGLPKGVMLTHENCVWNLEQVDHPELTDNQPTTDTFQEKALTVLPFFHIYGFNSILNFNLYKGIHTITMPKFTPDLYIKCLKEYKPTQLFVVPSLLLFLTTHPSVKPEYLYSVRGIISGAAPATKSLIDKFRNKFNHSGLVIRQGYGMTELSPCALLIPNKNNEFKDGSVGVLIRSTKARVMSLTDGKNLPAHQSGELLIKGPQIMKGYWKNQKATEETIDKDGWLHTGDVAYYDEDEFFYIIDRTKELIKVKGNQVSPTELENLIMKLPEVADVAVIGIPDALADEVPKAFVVLKPNQQLAPEKIAEYVNSRVVNYKKLNGGITFIDSVPRNAAGKILRHELKILGRSMSK